VSSRHERGYEHGQAAVELALGFPLVCLFLLALVQVVLVGRDAIAVAHAAREGARAAAVAADATGAAQRAVRAAVRLDPSRLTVAVDSNGGLVRVTVHYRAPTDVPIVGRLVHDVSLTEAVTMAVEP
jgi:Flp pilus assembly protein TadG